MTNNFTKLKAALESFNTAGQVLATVMEETHHESPQAKAIEFTAHKYPFPNCISDVSYAIHNWCEDLSEQLTHEQIEEFCKEKKYVMCYKDCSSGTDENYEVGWIYSVKNCDNFGEVKLIEEIESGGFYISWELFKENFIVIPNTLAELYYNETAKGSYEALCKIQELAKIMGEKVE